MTTKQITAVNDGFQLCAQSIEIHWRSYNEHIGLAHLLIDELHIVLLHTSMLLVSEASITAQAGIDLIIVYRHNFYLVPLRCTFDERLHQQFRVTTLPRAS